MLKSKDILLIILAVGVVFLFYETLNKSRVLHNAVLGTLQQQQQQPLQPCVQTTKPLSNATHMYRLSHANINTHKGYKSYEQILKEVWEPFGYTLAVPTIPIATLKHLNEPTCEKIFADWLEIAKTHDPHVVPPKTVPEELKQQYTMNGNAHVMKRYMDDRSTSSEGKWDQIGEWMNREDIISPFYGNDGKSIHFAMKYFNSAVRGKKGFIIGSLVPWVEVMALKNGAAHIDTLEYRKTEIIGDWPLHWVHPIEFSENWNKYANSYDFCASYSSIEHSGMQRYSDPPDPIGDIRELMKVRCVLKPGGYLFIGFPRGMDTVVYNIHRIYGRIRLAMMFTGFELLGVFQGKEPDLKMASPEYYDNVGSSGQLRQDTFVLRKV